MGCGASVATNATEGKEYDVTEGNQYPQVMEEGGCDVMEGSKDPNKFAELRAGLSFTRSRRWPRRRTPMLPWDLGEASFGEKSLTLEEEPLAGSRISQVDERDIALKQLLKPMLPWDFNEASATRDEPSIGTRISQVEERGITLRQLRPLWPYIRKTCGRERWLGFHGEALTPEDVNLYTACRYVIMPFTEPHRLSYVEMVACRAQPPTFFVSHFWGAPVRDFIACLEQHAGDRCLGEDAPYWVCAYANNQWDVGTAVTKDPADSAFRRAMRISEGTLFVLDAGGAVFTRVWCCYELAITLGDAGPLHMFDLVTANGHTFVSPDALQPGDAGQSRIERHVATCLSTAGEMPCDGGHSVHKSAREKHFPHELLSGAMDVRLQDGKASDESDRVHILNAVRNADDLDEAPVAEHEAYDQLNAVLCGRLAMRLLRVCTEAGLEDKCFAGIEGSSLKVFSADFSGCDAFTPEVAGKLFKSLPTTVEDLTLTGTTLRILPDELSKLIQLRSINLRGNAKLQTLPECVGTLPHLTSVSTAECVRLTTLPASFANATAERRIRFDLNNCPLTNDSWKPSWFLYGRKMYGYEFSQ